MLKLPLSRHIDRILVRFVVRHTAAVCTNRHKVIPHFQQEVVEADAQPAVVALRVTSLWGAAVLLYCRIIALLVHERQCRLVDVEERADFTVVYALVMFLLLLVQLQIDTPVDDLLRIVAVYIVVPVVVQERNTLFMLPNRSTPCLRIGVEREQVGLAPVLVRVQRHEQGIECAGGETLRIEARVSLARCV